MKAKGIKTDSLGDRVAELARESTGPRMLTGQTLAVAEHIAKAAKRTDIPVSVSRLRESGNTFSIILKFAGDKFAALDTLRPIVRMTQEDVTGYELAMRHLAQEASLLANPKAIRLPKIAARPWRDEQVKPADMLRFFPYCEFHLFAAEKNEEVSIKAFPSTHSRRARPTGLDSRVFDASILDRGADIFRATLGES